MDKTKSSSLVERLKQAALQQKREAITFIPADSLVVRCPQCGAGRAKQDGITKCGYCGYEFTVSELSNGINIKKEDHSR